MNDDRTVVIPLKHGHIDTAMGLLEVYAGISYDAYGPDSTGEAVVMFHVDVDPGPENEPFAVCVPLYMGEVARLTTHLSQIRMLVGADRAERLN